MKSHRQWVRAAIYAAVAIAILVLGLAAFVNVQQRLLRWRAERLLADIRAIQMGKSNLADAQRLMRKWGAWGQWQGECTERYCHFVISLDDASHALHLYPVLWGGNWGSELRWPRWMNRYYTWAGGRFAVVEASFGVRNGTIWSKEFGVLTVPSPPEYGRSGDMAGAASSSSVFTKAICSSSISHSQFVPNVLLSAERPEFSLTVGDVEEKGHWSVAEFTPYTDEETVRALFDFNLNCLTRWKECRTARELMPTAVSFYRTLKAEEINSASAPKPLPLWTVARDSEYVAIAVAQTRVRPSLDQNVVLISFRVQKLLKGESPIAGRSFYMMPLVGAIETCPVTRSDARTLRPGTRFILAFSGLINDESTSERDFYPCIVAQMSDENLGAIRLGLERDAVLRVPGTN